ncbi:MAG: hypothetical protein V3W41_10495 [Planctomycetota bacterium]
MPSTDAPNGPFKPFALLAFPMSLPGIAFGTLATLLFYLGNAGLALCFDSVGSGAEAASIFFLNLKSCLLGFHLQVAVGGRTLFILQSIWLLALWGVFGPAISRILALRLSREEYLGYRAALKFGFQLAPSAWLYPLVLLGVLAIPAIFNLCLGAAMQIPYVGLAFYLLLPLAWGASIFAVALMLSAIFGFGLVPGALAVEKKGTLDAWGKSLNYLFARPLHVLLYLVLLKVFLIDILLHYVFEVRIFRRWTEQTLKLAISSESFDRITAPVSRDSDSFEKVARFVFDSVTCCFDLLSAGFVVCCFFAGFVGMFLIFRRDVDGIDISDIDIEDPDPEFPAKPVER